MEFVSSAFKYLTSSNANLSSNPGDGMCIQLDRQIPVYFPGETITGRVIVTFAEQKEFKNLSILFEGRAQVHWTEQRSRTVGTGDNRRTESHTVHYNANENYFSYKLILLANPNGSDSVFTPPGTSVYPFYFTLPLNIPSSYNSRIGKVMYSMSARLKKAWYKFDVKSVVPFSVNGILDLNREVGAADRIVGQKEKYICCWPCRSGPIGIHLLIHRTGYVPGEIIPFTAEMTNSSTRRITASKAKLVQNVSYHANGKTKHEIHELARVNGPTLDRGESTTWRELEGLRIPPCPPTRLAGCHIINIEYEVKFEMVASGLSTNLSTTQRIIIGTIPLRAFFGDLMPSTVPHGLPTVTTPTHPGIPGIINPPYNPSFIPGQVPADNIPSAPPPADYNKADEAGGPALPSYPGGIPSMPPYPRPGAPQFGAGDRPVPSAPVFTDYPDLPPPSYGDIMGTNGGPGQNFFTGGATGNMSGDNNGSDPPPSYDMTTDDSFAPIYIRYGWSQEPPPAWTPPAVPPQQTSGTNEAKIPGSSNNRIL